MKSVKNTVIKTAAVLCLALSIALLILSVTQARAKRAPVAANQFQTENVSAMFKNDEGALIGTNGGIVKAYIGGEPVWEYSRLDSAGAAPVVRAAALYGGKAIVAYGDRLIGVFDLASGEQSGWFSVGLEPQSLYLGEGGDFAVYADTNNVKSVYLLNAYGGGTLQNPQAYSRSKTIDSNKGLSDGFNYFVYDGGFAYVCSRTASVYKIDISGAITADGVEQIYYGTEDVLALQRTGGGFCALTNSGSVINFNEDFNEISRTGGGGALSSALVSGNLFVAKRRDGGISGINSDGRERFNIKTARNSLLIYASQDSFAYLTDDGGELIYISSSYAVKMQRAQILFPLFTVLCVAAFIACAFTALCGFTVTRRALGKFFKKLGKTLYKHKFAYCALIPTFALLIMFYYYPIIWGFGLSFFDYKVGESAAFVGLDNIAAVIRNTAFWKSFLNMLVLLVTDLIKALVPPVLFAECILSVKSRRFSFWVRALLFIPGILPGVAGTLVWAEGVFGSGSSGLLNSALKAVFPSFVTQSWLQQESTALPSLIFFGFPWIGSYLIFYGAIQGIPESMYEAARLDGCGRLRRVFAFDLPLILPQIKYVLISGFIASVQDYGRIYITTRGDFGTNTPSLMMYLAITEQKSYGIASAMSLFIFAFLLVATILNFKMQSRRAEE